MTYDLTYSNPTHRLIQMPGAHDRNRTGDLVLTKDVLYRLSYMGDLNCTSSTRLILERVMGIEPTSSAWKAEVLPLNYTRCVRALGT